MAKDAIHDAVVTALKKDGWIITKEQYALPVGQRGVFIDIAADRDVIVAEREDQRIAVEVKSFLGLSAVQDLRDAVGQYMLYRFALELNATGRVPYLAVSVEAARGILSEPIGIGMLNSAQINLVIVDKDTEEVAEWKPWNAENTY